MYNRAGDTMIRQISPEWELSISDIDRKVLRDLALEIKELASQPIQQEKRKLWYSLNKLEKVRPLIFCDPENGWYEIITNRMLVCEGEIARDWEWLLRRELFWGKNMGDDKPMESYFDIPCFYEETGWGMKEIQRGGENGGSYQWESPLKDYNQLSEMHFPEIIVNHEKTNKVKELAMEVMGDILEIRIKTLWWWSLGMTELLIKLRGLEQLMYDFYDYPDELHCVMSFLRDGHLARLKYLEENSLLSLNNNGVYIASGGLGYTDELPAEGFNADCVRTIDLWGFSDSQETSEVSPEMFKEFIFPYQLPLMKKFGLNCYGCCEALDSRWYVIKDIPGLRRVSVSPWADLHEMADKLQDKYIYSMKPNPADLAVKQINEDIVRNKLREALKITQNCKLEIIMKDNHTLGGNPQNAIRWCQIAKEEIERL